MIKHPCKKCQYFHPVIHQSGMLALYCKKSSLGKIIEEKEIPEWCGNGGEVKLKYYAQLEERIKSAADIMESACYDISQGKDGKTTIQEIMNIRKYLLEGIKNED